MLSLLKRTVMGAARQVFALRGYEIRKITPRDRRGEDVVSAVREPLLSRPVLVEAPVESCRGLFSFPLTREGHPFVATLLAYEEGICRTYEGSPLEAFYDAYQPHSAVDVLGLSHAEAPGFAGKPALAFSMPWKPGEPSSNLEGKHHIAHAEAEEHGVDTATTMGAKGFGPATAQQGRFEFQRLTSVYDSIKQTGYHRHDGEDGDLEGTLFLDTDMSWFIRIWRGHHRVAALIALGYDHLPIRIRHAPVRASEVDYWPQVQEGRITREGALSVFYRIMNGETPPSHTHDSHTRRLAVGRHP